ncbi:MAG: 3-hydroxyacyl-CoA dehydrogenase NAD-binding domain-containing protein [Hyphomicrobiales bacterium]
MRAISEKRNNALTALTKDPLSYGPCVDDQPKELKELSLKDWRVYMDTEGVAWLIADRAGSSANSLSRSVLEQMDKALSALERVRPKALVLRSAKQSGFIMGADISEFADLVENSKAKELMLKGLHLLDRLEGFPAPTIAVLHGYCLGGGLEVALACTYRIATEDARIGFPEVQLGLHPGLAGTWRTLRMVNPDKALELMLTGRSLYAKQAKNMGLVDQIVQERHVLSAISAAQDGKLKVDRELSTKGKAMTLGPARTFIAGQMEKEVSKKARRDHYPAPYALIDLWRRHGGDLNEMRRAETDSFARLLTSATSENLVRVFFLREELKAAAKRKNANIEHVHVIGAGVMGGDIAAWAAYNGYRVTLQDMEAKLIAPAIERATKLFKRRLRGPGEARAASDRLIPDVAGDGIAKADLIIEAVTENPDIKQIVYRQCEAHMKRGAILATNTSSILLKTLAKDLKNPKRFCGIHFFNPVAKMPLVEIVTHDLLDTKILNRVTAWVDDIGKLPLVVRSAPGFLVNRALTPYMMEAFIAYDEGVPPELIDKAAEDFGMPMGPIELADQVGLDVALHVAKVMKQGLGKTFPDVPGWFEDKVKSGDIGRKSGRGIYSYDADGKPEKSDLEKSDTAELQDRLILPLLNACVACLDDGIVETSDLIDGGVIFGTGFAPFRGGPMHYIEKRGAQKIQARLTALKDQFGPRFTPHKGWKKL